MSIRSSAVGLAVVGVLMGAGAAQSLSGSNTVFTDDIAPKQVYGSDIADNAVSGTKVYPNSITGADVNESTLIVTPADNSVTSSEVEDDSLAGADIDESTLALTCPTDGFAMTRYGDVCATELRGPHKRFDASGDCSGEGLRLPSIGEAEVIARFSSEPGGWTDALYYDGTEMRGVVVDDVDFPSTGSPVKYRCVITVGARP